MKNRDYYLNQLVSFKDSNLVKVITGLRRCGKSSLLLLFKEYLINSGIENKNIIYINFELMEFDEINDYKELYDYISGNMVAGKNYILLDEIGEVSKWEKAIRSLLIDSDVDIYLTGSNAYLLSSELATVLTGRCVEIKMLPLSFKEYVDFYNFDENVTNEKKFEKYLEFGGLPAISALADDEFVKKTYINDIYNMILNKDVVARNNIKDVSLLERVFKFVSQNIGNSISSTKISDFLTSSGNKTNHMTIENYLKCLEGSYLIYKASRYDIKGKQLLKTLGKYYIVDIGIRNSLVGLRNTDYGHVLENVVYFELLRRGYTINIGKNDEYEVDFIAEKIDEKKYIQVTYKLSDDEIINRELRAFENIKDNYEKIIISYDNSFSKDINGIKFINIIDFLLED